MIPTVLMIAPVSSILLGSGDLVKATTTYTTLGMHEEDCLRQVVAYLLQCVFCIAHFVGTNRHCRPCYLVMNMSFVGMLATIVLLATSIFLSDSTNGWLRTCLSSNYCAGRILQTIGNEYCFLYWFLSALHLFLMLSLLLRQLSSRRMAYGKTSTS